MKRIRILALLLAVAVMVMMAIMMLPNDAENQPAEEKRPVIVARQTIPAYVEITADMLETVEYPESTIPANAIVETDAAVGCRTLVEISAQEVLMSNHLLAKDAVSGGLAMALEEGMRAMSVRVDEVSGVSNLLRVGNQVDVIAVLNTADDKIVSKMLLENVKVVALGNALAGTPVNGDGVPYYSTVTLAVTPQAAVNLAFACNDGTVYLVARAQNDDNSVSTASVRVENIAG